MKRLLFILLLVLPLAAETLTVEVELPENPGGDYSGAYLKELMEGVATRVETYMNRRENRLYVGDLTVNPPLLGACGNWKKNYDGNGICDDLPVPPLMVQVRTEYNGVGWGLVLNQTTAPVADLCSFDDAWLARLSTACRSKLGLGALPPPASGVVHVGECWWNGRCRAFADDTVTHGTMIAGSNFSDGKPRYKASYMGPFGVQQWYQLAKPE